MKLEEAIEQLERALADKWCPWSPELKASIRLGIEALKRRLPVLARLRDPAGCLLPGETED